MSNEEVLARLGALRLTLNALAQAAAPSRQRYYSEMAAVCEHVENRIRTGKEMTEGERRAAADKMLHLRTCCCEHLVEDAQRTHDLCRESHELAQSLRRIAPKLEPASQVANLKRLLGELEALPVHNPDDGFSSRDHDDALYREPR